MGLKIQDQLYLGRLPDPLLLQQRVERTDTEETFIIYINVSILLTALYSAVNVNSSELVQALCVQPHTPEPKTLGNTFTRPISRSATFVTPGARRELSVCRCCSFLGAPRYQKRGLEPTWPAPEAWSHP